MSVEDKDYGLDATPKTTLTRRRFLTLAGAGLAGVAAGGYGLYALASEGGGSGGDSGAGGSSGGGTWRRFVVWYDHWENNEPVQGWGDASIEWFIDKMDSMVTEYKGSSFRLDSTDSAGRKNREYFKEQAWIAINNAVKRAQDAGYDTDRGRLIAVGWNALMWYDIYGFWIQGSFSDHIPRPGNDTEWDSTSGWWDGKHDESQTWAEYIYGLAQKDCGNANYGFVVIAVADGWPPRSTPLTVVKTMGQGSDTDQALRDYAAACAAAGIDSGYSVAGAEFELYEADGVTVAEAQYDNNGKAGDAVEGVPTFHVAANGTSETYWVKPDTTFVLKESVSPTNGSCGDSTGKTIEITSGANEDVLTTTSVAIDNPMAADPFVATIQKVDDEGYFAQGGATLAGARYRVSFYPGIHTTRAEIEKLEKENPSIYPYCSAVWEAEEAEVTGSDDKKRKCGRIYWAEDEPVEGTWPFKNANGVHCCPYGTLAIWEVQAPVGYTVDDSWYIRTSDASSATFYDQYGKKTSNWIDVPIPQYLDEDD